MTLDAEWTDRVDAWRAELARHVSTPVCAIEMEGFETAERLSPAQAAGASFRPMLPGTPWGRKWHYGWFRAQVQVPPEASGQRIAVTLDAGAEALVFVDGLVAGAMDKRHRHVLLSEAAEAGRSYELLMEAYAGHGPTPCHPGPTPPGRVTVPEPPDTQALVGESRLIALCEDAYQLLMDVETLYHLRKTLHADSLRLAEIDAGLRDFTLIADFEQPADQMLATLCQARDRLRGLLGCTNGSTAPVMYCFGHGHLDTAWLWPIAESRRKAARTVSNQLALAEQHPGYRFLMSQPAQYAWLMEDYGELYARLKRAVAEGKIIADGGMWVEADTNISGGEALIRQFLYGKRFFREEFGIDSQVLWLPDVFGYSAAMPQIMAGCGVNYFSTAKIFWTYHGGDRFPLNEFVWEGIDGTGVLAHLHNDYNARTDPASVVGLWRGRVQKDGFSARLMPFGWGDGGGGPERDHLEYVRRAHDLEGCPKMRYSSPRDFFERLERNPPANRYVGELYYQSHRGVLTSQARCKRGNRKAELALRECEMWGAVAAAGNLAWPAERIERAWKLLLTNQFHDILPGSSIARVYEQTASEHAEAISLAQTATEGATGSLVEEAEALTVFNSLNWPRPVLVELPAGARGATGAEGQPLCVQQVADATCAEVEVPSCGWTTVTPSAPPASATASVPSAVGATTGAVENGLLRIDLNAAGEIAGVFDKRSGRQLAAGTCNELLMFKDVPTRFDAWDIDSMYRLQPVELGREARIEVVTAGPLVAKVRVRRSLGESEMEQEISLRRGSARVDFRTTIDWRERHRLLKVGFDLALHADEAIHEIQFGHVRRPNHRSRPFDADRFEVCNHKWTALAEELGGAAVLNDCKYGVSVTGGRIELTLLRAPLGPDMNADRGRQEFTYALYCWTGSLADSGLVREGYDLNCPALVRRGAGGRRSVLGVSEPNVIVETVKPAEDGSGDVVVRLYESMRTATRCVLTCDLPVTAVQPADMLERPAPGAQPVRDQAGGWTLGFRPFEIKTLRLKLSPDRRTE
jgi:alpha-mannosidase